MIKELLRKGQGPVVLVERRADGEIVDPFIEAATKADKLRDAREFVDAEIAYAEALELRPHAASYWIQHGHCLRENGLLVEAEISYRTGLALGAPPADVLPHVRFVMAVLGIVESRQPLRLGSVASLALPMPQRVPTKPALELLGTLLWGVPKLETSALVHLLRENDTLDDAFADMVNDARFRNANASWLGCARPEDI